MTRQYDSRQDRSVDLVDTIWRILMQWKPLLIVMIVCGIVLSGYMYGRRARDYKEQMEMSEMSKQELIDAMGNDAYKKVEGAVSNQINADLARKYQNESILLQQRPYYERNLFMEYKIQTTDGSAEAVADMYTQMLIGDKLVKRIAKAIDYDGDLSYIRELIKTSYVLADTNLVIMEVTVILSEDMDAKAVARAVNSYVRNSVIKAAEEGVVYTVTKVAQTVKYVRDNELSALISNTQSAINTYDSGVEGLVKDGSEAQRLLYREMLSVEREKYGIESDEEPVISPVTPTFSKAFFIIGAFMGAMLYACILLGWAIIRPTIASTINILDTYGLYLIEEHHDRKFSGFLGKFIYSKLVYGLRFNSQKCTVEESTAQAASQIEGLAKREKASRVVLCEMCKKKEAAYTNYVVKLKEALTGVHVPVEVIDEPEVKASLIKAEEGTAVVFVTCEDRTTYRFMDEVRGNADRYHIPILGVVALDA